MMSFHTTRGNFTSLKSCTTVNECFYSENGDMVANFASARYQFSRSLTDSSTYAEQNTYSLSVRFRIVTLDEISKSNTNVTMYYYPDNSNNYSLATCDGTQELTISKNTDYDYYVTYKCNEFTINRDISHMGLMIGGYPNSIYFVQMAQNLQLIGPGEATNDDIINNQNSNTDKITQNQDENTDKQIQENRNLLQQLFDFLVGLFIPDSFDLEKVKEGLTEAGIEYRIDPNIVRGLDYYTKTVFEFIDENNSNVNFMENFKNRMNQ